jgi:hypothetical protein
MSTVTVSRCASAIGIGGIRSQSERNELENPSHCGSSGVDCRTRIRTDAAHASVCLCDRSNDALRLRYFSYQSLLLRLVARALLWIFP